MKTPLHAKAEKECADAQQRTHLGTFQQTLLHSPAWALLVWAKHVQQTPWVTGLKCWGPVRFIRIAFSTHCVRAVLGKTKRSTRFITSQGAYPIYLTSVFSPWGFGPVQSEVRATGPTVRAGERQGRSGAEAGNSLNHQLVSLWGTGSLSSWEKIQFVLTQTTHTWQGPSLVFTRVPPSPTLFLTRQFHCCKLSDKLSWSSHMFLLSFWSDRQLPMCSICPPWFPACPREASSTSEQSREQLGMGRSPYGISSVTLRPPCPPFGYPPCFSPAQPPQSPMVLLWLCYICAFEALRKFKPLRLVFLRGGWGAASPARSVAAWWPSRRYLQVLEEASPPLPTPFPTPHSTLTLSPGEIPTEANRNVAWAKDIGLH